MPDKLPHTEEMPLRFPVTLTQLPLGIATSSPPSPKIDPPSFRVLASGVELVDEIGMTHPELVDESATTQRQKSPSRDAPLALNPTACNHPSRPAVLGSVASTTKSRGH